MSEYIPKYPSKEEDDSNKTSSELLAETLKPIYVPQDLMLAWETHLASYSRDTNVLLDQVKDSELALNTQYQALFARVQKYEQMLQDITMDSNEFTMDTDEVNFTGWNILAQASYWDYLLRKEITKLSDQIKSTEYKGGLVTEVTDAVLEGLIADNTYISNVIGALSDTPLIRELDAALTSTTTSLAELQAEYVRLAEKQAADAEALANQQVENAEQLAESINTAVAEQLDRLAEEAAIRTQLLQELEAKTDAITADYNAVVDTLHTTVIQELTTIQDGISASVSELKTTDEAIITSLDAYKVSNGQNIAALQNSVNAVTNTQESIATQVTGLIASFDQIDLGLSRAQADIITSNQARADGDEALSQQITTINAGLGNVNSRIDTVSESVSTLDSATATKFSALNAELIDVNTSVASARQIADSAVTANTAQASEIDTLNARMSTTEGNVIKKADATALSNLETKVDNADAALSIRIDSLVANLTTPDGTKIDVNAFNALRAEVLTNSGNITTHTSQITALNSSLNDVNTGLSANANAVANLTTKVTQQGESITSHSQAIQQLQSDLDVAEAGLATKASTTALNTTNTNVSSLDGRVTATTDSLNSLGSRMDTVEGAVSTKLDASVISDYYTKGQAEDKSAEIAAGKIESYDANLVIGGANLLTETKTFNKAGTLELSKTTLRPNYVGFGSAFVTDTASMLWRTHTVVQVRKDWCGFYYSCNSDNPDDWFADQDMMLSVWVKNSTNTDINAYGIVPALGLVATIPIGEWQRIEVRIEKGRALRNSSSQGIIEFHNPSTEGAFYYAAPMLQYGNAVTSWQPSQEEVQNALDANASAIQATNSEVTRINGVVTSQASSISLLQSSLSDVDAKSNTAINNAATAQQTANTAVTAVEANAGIITKLESSLASGVGSRNYLLNSAEVGTAKVISEDFNFMELEIGDVIQMSFDIDITSPVSAGVRDRIGYELYSPLQDGGDAWVGVWLHGVSSLGVTKQRVNNAYTVVSKFTTNPKNFSYHVQTEGGAFTVKNVQLNLSKIPVKTWSAAPEDLATASALNNYYTKTQADDKALTIAAGEVSKYDANLVIGGTNLLLNSDFSGDASWSKWGDNGGGYVKVADPTYGTVLQTNLPSGIVHAWVKLENNVEYTYSALVKPSNNLWSNGNVPLHYWAGKDNVHQNKIHVLSYSPTLIEAGKWTRINIVFKLIDDADSFRPYIFGLNGVLQIAWTKLERGNKATDWSPNSVEMQHSINANASAVQSTKAEVLRIDGIVTSQASQIVTLESSKSAIENGGIAGNDEFIVDLRDPAYNRDLYYPVLLSAFSTEYRQTIRVMATLNGASVPPWSSHEGGFSLNAQFQMGGAGWGTINPEIVTDNFSYSWTHGSISPLDQIGQIWESSQPFFYVRGGGYYRLSKPVNRSVRVCAPNGSLSGYYGGTLYPRPYQESTVPKSINQGLNQQNVKLQQTNAVLDGVKAVSTVTIDNNGVMSGYGLISALVNGQVTSAFGVNADTFYIGKPTDAVKPFVVTSVPTTIDGIDFPAGTWINSAIIANATIGTAKIKDASITDAKIANLDASKITAGTMHGDRITAGTFNGDRIVSNSITSDKLSVNSLSAISANLGTIQVGNANIAEGAITAAKIGDLQVDTLKIKDRAVTVPHFISKAGITPIILGPFSHSPNSYPVTTFLDWKLTDLPPNQYTMVTIRGAIAVKINGDMNRVSGGSRMYLLIGDTYVYDRHVTSGEQAWESIYWGYAPKTGQAQTLLVKTDSSGDLKIKAVFGATTFNRYVTVKLSHTDIHMNVLELKK